MAHRLAPRASLDLDEIWYHIASESGNVATADRQITSITSRFFLLTNHPHLGRRRDSEFGPGFRSFPVDDHVIIYRVVNDDVLILRVAHGRRDIEALFGS